MDPNNSHQPPNARPYKLQVRGRWLFELLQQINQAMEALDEADEVIALVEGHQAMEALEADEVIALVEGHPQSLLHSTSKRGEICTHKICLNAYIMHSS